MKSCCNDDSAYSEDMNPLRQRNNDEASTMALGADEKSNTIHGLEKASDVSEYEIGVGIDVMIQQVCSQIMNEDFLKVLVKHKSPFYFNCTVAHVARGDGILGEKEKKYLIRTSKQWGLSDDDIKEVLKGKNCTKEMLQVSEKALREVNPNDSDEQIAKKLNLFSYALLLQSIIAATQDGLVDKEYTAAKKLAVELGFDKSAAREAVKAVKAEIVFYNNIKSVMHCARPGVKKL